MFKDILNEIYIMCFSDEYYKSEDYKIFDDIFDKKLKTDELKEEIKQEILAELKKN